jgi:hypothetical protein
VLDLIHEKPIPLSAACKLIPPGRSGRRCHLSTLLRWILRGAKSPTGEVVRLEALRLGDRWVTSAEAIQRFAQRLTPALDTEPALPGRTPGRRRRDSERAAERLEQIGI